jgi:integrase/recombinase XerD
MIDIEKYIDYLLGNNCSKATIDSYSRTVTQFLELIQKKPEDITKEDVEKYKLDSIKTKKYDGNSLIPKYAAINHLMEFLEKPYRLNSPKKHIKNKVPLTRNEIQLLFETSKNHLRDHAILKTLYFTQLRRTEIINLNIQDVDFQRKKIRVNEGKGNESAEVNIHPDALNAISNYLTGRKPAKNGHEQSLFLSKNGKRICKNSIAHLIKKYASQVGIEKRVYPHLFRISSITHMAERGLNFEEIRQQSRHKRYDTLKIYVQMSNEHARQAYMRGLSFNNGNLPLQKNTMENSFTEKTNSKNESILSINYKQELVKKLATGEITNESFLLAVNLLKNQTKLPDIKGYQ